MTLLVLELRDDKPAHSKSGHVEKALPQARKNKCEDCWVFLVGAFPMKSARLYYSWLFFSVHSEWSTYLVGAFLEKRVDYSKGFSSVFQKYFSIHLPEVTKTVLPQKFYKILRSRQIILVGPRNWTKKVSRVTYNTGRDQRVTFQFFSALQDFFRGISFSQETSFQLFFGILRFFSKISFQKMVSNLQKVFYFEVLLQFLSFRNGADLGRSGLLFILSTS